MQRVKTLNEQCQARFVGKLASTLSLLLLGAIVVIVFSKYVPYNMDEFSMYHTIMCHHYKNNMLNEFREGCSYYDLNFLNTGLILPLREYHYMGSFTSLYYYPLFLLWKSPVSARFMGIIFLIMQALILSKIFRTRFEYILLGLAGFFPYFFQHVVFSGVVAYPITSVFLIYYLFIKWFEKFQLRYLLFTSILIFLGVWMKLNYIWLLPGLGIVFVMLAVEKRKTLCKRENIRKLVFHLLVSGAVLFALMAMLFLSTLPTYYDKPYLGQLTSGGSEIHPVTKIFSQEIVNLPIFKNFINPLEATSRIYSVTAHGFSYIFDAFLYLSIPLLWILAFFSIKTKTEIWKSIILYICFAITVFVIFITPAAGQMHHALLAFPFLILSGMTILHCLKTGIAKKILIGWLILFILLNVYFFTAFPKQEFLINQEYGGDFSKNHLNRILNDDYLANNYFYVIVDWGMYYYQALYGKNTQSVLYIEPLNEEEKVRRLHELSNKHNRKLLFIYNSKINQTEFIKSSFSVKPCKLNEETEMWKILLEEDENPANPCFKK